MVARAIQVVTAVGFATIAFGLFGGWNKRYWSVEDNVRENGAALLVLLACLVVCVLAEFAYQYGKREKK